MAATTTTVVVAVVGMLHPTATLWFICCRCCLGILSPVAVVVAGIIGRSSAPMVALSMGSVLAT